MFYKTLHSSLKTAHSGYKPSSLPFILKTSVSQLVSQLSWGQTFFQIWGFSTYPWTLPIQSVNPAHPYHSHILSKSSCPYPHISPLPPPHSYRLTPNHLHSYAPHAQTTSIYHASPPQPRSEPLKDCTNQHCASYPSATPRTSISPSSVPSSPGFADLQPSSPRFQSYMSIHSGHKPCISFPLCGMMHPELSG